LKLFTLKTLALFVFLCAAAFAQETNALLTGIVLDPSGGTVPGATVVAINVKTGVTNTQLSNTSGVYTFTVLLPGEYRVSADKQGFKKTVVESLTLRTADQLELNLKLEVGTNVETVQVTAEAEGVTYLTPSLSGVINSTRIADLPTVGRSVMDFVTTQPGLVSSGANGVNVNGARTDMLNVTLDGINILDNVINETIQNVQLNTTVDRIEELRVVTSPADAEFGRGSGQVIAIGRSGTNSFHGAVYDYLRNSSLNANTWANNRNATARPILRYNNPGARLGGPIRKNKTFFFGLFESTQIRQLSNLSATVPTDALRNGIFRFYPGVTNANAIAARPVVDANGNPVQPSTATGALQSVSLFGLDPNRLTPDATGNVAKTLALLPSPNTFTIGDGLNTGGYLFTAPTPTMLYSFSTRVDHNISEAERLFVSFSRDQELLPNGNDTSPLPTSQGGAFDLYAFHLSYGLNSVLRSNLINEFHGGATIATFDFLAPWSVHGTDILPSVGGNPYLLQLGAFTSPYGTGTAEDPQGRKAPVYQYGDKITWIKGIHRIKAGYDLRFLSEQNYVAFDVMPRVALGVGNVATQNIQTISGIGANATAASSDLATLSGSVSQVLQQFYSPGGANPKFVPGLRNDHNWRQKEMDWFFQDDIKVRKNLTINLGIRWEYYGVPSEANGLAVGLVGGSAAAFGVSGTDFSALFHPGVLPGQLTQLQLIGKNSPNPSQNLWQPQYKNFAPAAGLAWNLPWTKFGMDKSVLRLGYGIAYERNQLGLLDQLYGFGAPGLGTTTSILPSTYTNLNGIAFPLTTSAVPLATVPINDTNASTQTALIADSNLKSPYIQNWNVSFGREVAKGYVVDVRYVGSKASKLFRGTNVDELNIFENGILNAFQVTDAGGSSPLLNQIFKGLNVTGAGVVDGTTVTGSDAVRKNTTLNAFLLNNNVGGFAQFLAYNTFITGVRGGLLKNGGLPVNFVDANPQFGAVDLIGNFGNSTFHSLQIEMNKRYSHGFQIQASYVRSKALGDFDGNTQSEVSSFLTLRNQHLDKRLLSFDVPNALRTSGILDLPFGPGRKYFSSSHGIVEKLVGGWQTAVIYNHLSGTPTTFSTGTSTTPAGSETFNGLTSSTAILNGSIPSGNVHFSGNNVLYFNGLSQVQDPSNLNMPAAIRANTPLLAVVGANGQVILQNPLPGTLGGLGPTVYRGLGSFTFNGQLSKSVTLNKERGVIMTLRADATNLLNKPIWGTPNLNINSTSFGLITTATGNRGVQLGARIDF
jgi:Carboxypeptidase regulatory-like domain